MARTSRQELYSGIGNGFALGFAFVATVLVLTGLGALADSALRTGHVFLVVLSVVGFAGAFLRLVFNDRYEAARRESLGLAPVTQREVPSVLQERTDAVRRRGAPHGIRRRRFGDPVPDDLAVAVAAKRAAERRMPA